MVVALEGVIVIGDEMFASVEAVWPLPSLAFPVMVHEVCFNGAVNRPEEVMLPQEAVQVEAALAVNCWVAPSLTVGFRGEILYVEAALTLM